MNEEKILEIIYEYLPQNLYIEDEEYQKSVEFKKLKSIINKSQMNNEWWNSFAFMLQNRFQEFRVENWTQFFNQDRCFRIRVWLNDYEALMIHVSILGNYSAIYYSIKEQKDSIPSINFEGIPPLEVIEFIDAELNQKYKVNRVSGQTLIKIINNVAVGNTILGETTIFDCLFTDHKF